MQERHEDVGATLVADRQPPIGQQPSQGALHLPAMAAQPSHTPACCQSRSAANRSPGYRLTTEMADCWRMERSLEPGSGDLGEASVTPDADVDRRTMVAPGWLVLEGQLECLGEVGERRVHGRPDGGHVSARVTRGGIGATIA